MAHVQGPGRVGRDKLDHHALAIADWQPKLRALASTSRTHLLFGSWLEADVDETGTGDVHRIHPLGKRRAGQQVGRRFSAS
jgi:hypothetical protein